MTTEQGRGREGRRSRRLGSGERGAAFVEFALVVPLLLTIVLGGISGGTVLSRKETLTHAAREGARYGAIVAKTQCKPTSQCGGLTWAQLVQSAVVSRSQGLVASGQVCVSMVTGLGTVVDGSSDFTTRSDGTPCYDDGGADGFPRVQVTITRTGDKVNVVFFQIPVTLAAQATARFEQ